MKQQFWLKMMLYLLVCTSLGVRRAHGIFSYPNEPPTAKTGQFPWQANLFRAPGRLIGAGVILSRFYVLSICKRKPFDVPGEIGYSNIKVAVGTISILPEEFQGAQLRWIYYWEDHPKCRMQGDAASLWYDLSVIKVTQMFIFNDLVKVIPFELDQAKFHTWVTNATKESAVCTFAAWGAYRYGKIIIRPGQKGPIYIPPQPEYLFLNNSRCDWCFPNHLRYIEMELITHDQCIANPGRKFFYRRLHVSENVSVCALGKGSNGNSTFMNRTGMTCTGDSGGSLLCNIAEGKPIIIGLNGVSSLCHILWADIPTVFSRLDSPEMHPWVKRFYNPDMFGPHWVGPDYTTSFIYYRNFTFSGPIPPEITSAEYINTFT